ncbi:hypothetical protein Angca_001361 [Angiostrongylus cantonensis]|nr:hypothetical protein Angca_001361 [Angiostrongylus cantonensis]
MDRACHLLHDGDTEDYSDSELSIENFYLHICHEEGQEFAGVTTFHGMIRIFTSRTWTSLIFWVLIVSTCLVFFMIFSGYILSSYAKANTFMRRYFETYNVQNASLSICGSPEKGFHTFLDFPCYAPCFSLHWKTTTSYSRTLRGLRITLEISNMMEVFVEVRKMAITDVLSFIGGGTSLFLGCSCVTLMETFIFLLKLVLQSINKETCERIELENASISIMYSKSFISYLVELLNYEASSTLKTGNHPVSYVQATIITRFSTDRSAVIRTRRGN